MGYENGFDWKASAAMSRRSFVALMGLTGTALGLTACDLPFIGGGDGGGTPKKEPMKSLIVCKSRGSEMFYLDPMPVSSVGATELFNHIMEGLARWEYDDGVLVVKPAIAEPVTDPETGREQLPEPVKNPDGTVTYEYRLREDAVWSDNEPVTADDFVYAWNRCANIENNAPFRDLFDCIAGYSNDPTSTRSVYAKDARTLSVTLTKNLPYWNELIAFTPFLPLRSDFVRTGDYTWASNFENAPYNGPYKVKSVVVATLDSNTDSLILEKNETYYKDVPGPEEIRFVYGRDLGTQLDLIEHSSDDLLDQDGSPKSVHILYNVASETIEKSKSLPDVQRRAVPLLGTEWFVWNVNKVLVPETLGLVGNDYEQAQAEIRKAFCLLMNRNAACSKCFGFKPASSIVPPGMGDAGGADFASNSGSSGGGYYDTSEDSFPSNCQLAIDILRKYYPYDEASGKFTWFVPTVYSEAGSNNRLSIPARYLLNACNEQGLHMEFEVNDYTQMLSKHQTGDFELSISNWYADFTDPVTFLSMWTTTSSHNAAQFGRGRHADARLYSLDLSSIGEETRIENGKWSETYDVLIDRIANEDDKTKRFALLHKAEDMVMSTGAIMPIWHPAAAHIIKNNIEGLISTPFNWMYFGNVSEK